MSVKNVMVWWTRINLPLWLGYELGTPSNDKRVRANIRRGAIGICKGVAASICPPLGIWYAYNVCKNLD